MSKIFNASGVRTAEKESLPDLNKRCSGRNCEVCDHYKGLLERLGNTSTSDAYMKSTLAKWNHHINWSEPCNGSGCNTCHYIKKASASGVGGNPEAERLKSLGVIEDDEHPGENAELNKFLRHVNSQEPGIQSFPLNFGVPRIIASADHPGGFIGEDPHSKYTETVAFVTDNPMHSCSRCMPVCEICGTRDTPGRIKDGVHTSEYSGECRRRQQGLGFIPNYN